MSKMTLAIESSVNVDQKLKASTTTATTKNPSCNSRNGNNSTEALDQKLQ